MKTAAGWLKERLHYKFSEEELLTRALTHRSASSRNNERLEFLGDAVLDAVISEAVFRARPGADEGDMSRLRAALVKDDTLAALATELGVGEHLVLGPGEKKAGGHRRASIIADALEAIFGAIYIDAGYEQAARAITRIYANRIENLPDADDLRDPKTRLQEMLQADRRPLPDYRIEKISGKAHRQSFVVRCVNEEPPMETTGKGRSRRDAEQEAARKMLAKLGGMQS